MAEELSMKDLQMKGLTEKITGLLAGLDKSKRKELDLSEIGSRLKEFQISLDSASIEQRHLGAHPQKNEFRVMLRDHKNTLKELKNEYEWKKSSAVKEELLGDHKPGADAANALETEEGLMKHGLDTQDKSKESLARTLRVVNDTRTIGQDTVLKLEANSSQIEGMYDNLEDIESTLARSTKIIKRMARKVATDKYVWVIVSLVFAAIVFIIIYTQVQKRRGKSTPNVNTVTIPTVRRLLQIKDIIRLTINNRQLQKQLQQAAVAQNG